MVMMGERGDQDHPEATTEASYAGERRGGKMEAIAAETRETLERSFRCIGLLVTLNDIKTQTTSFVVAKVTSHCSPQTRFPAPT